jgi:peroxiredoxin
MSARWNANTLLLSLFVLILIGAGLDYGRRVLGENKSEVPKSTAVKGEGMNPDFAVGDPAPDFALPDSQKRVHKLSELVKGETLLFFACGCQNCKQVQTWLADFQRSGKVKVPPVITITSAPPESEQSWFRDTGLKQTMLFHTPKDQPDPMILYKGKPCPRIYIVNGDRTVKFIGTSMILGGGTESIGMQIAKELGVGSQGASRSEMMKVMGPKQYQKTVPKQEKPIPSLPPYAQPPSAFPGGKPAAS